MPKELNLALCGGRPVVNAYVPNAGQGLKRLQYRLESWCAAPCLWPSRLASGPVVQAVRHLATVCLSAPHISRLPKKRKTTPSGAK